MTWRNDRAARAASDRTYKDPVYQRNKAIVRQRSGGRCEVVENGRRCNSRDRVQCDHIIPRSQGGTHAVSNLRDTCKPHHDKKTATEGGGWRQPKSDPSPTVRTKWLP